MSRTPTQDLTFPGRAFRRATSVGSAPAWVAVALAVMYLRQEIIWWTDKAYRRSLIESVPNYLGGVTEVANVIMSIAGVVGVFVALYRYLLATREEA